MSESSARTWRFYASMCRDAESTSHELDALICKQLEHDLAHTVTSVSSMDAIIWTLHNVLPGSSYQHGYISHDHEEGEDAPEGHWVKIFLPWDCDEYQPEEGTTVEGRKDSPVLCFLEALCTAMSYAVQAPKKSA